MADGYNILNYKGPARVNTILDQTPTVGPTDYLTNFQAANEEFRVNPFSYTGLGNWGPLGGDATEAATASPEAPQAPYTPYSVRLRTGEGAGPDGNGSYSAMGEAGIGMGRRYIEPGSFSDIVHTYIAGPQNYNEGMGYGLIDAGDLGYSGKPAYGGADLGALKGYEEGEAARAFMGLAGVASPLGTVGKIGVNAYQQYGMNDAFPGAEDAPLSDALGITGWGTSKMDRLRDNLNTRTLKDAMGYTASEYGSQELADKAFEDEVEPEAVQDIANYQMEQRDALVKQNNADLAMAAFAKDNGGVRDYDRAMTGTNQASRAFRDAASMAASNLGFGIADSYGFGKEAFDKRAAIREKMKEMAATRERDAAAAARGAAANRAGKSSYGLGGKEFGGYMRDKYGQDAFGSASGGPESGDSGGKIVCTAMNEAYGFGGFRNAIWLDYAKKNLTPYHEKGYHAIFKPLIKIGYGSDGIVSMVVRGALEHIARHRSVDLWRLRRGKKDMLGRIYRKVLEPICYIAGRVIK